MEVSIERILLVIFVVTTGVLAGLIVGPSLQAMPVAITMDGAMFFEGMLIIITVFLMGVLVGALGEVVDTEIYFLILAIIGFIGGVIGIIASTI